MLWRWSKMAGFDDDSRQQPRRMVGGFSREVARRVFAEELRNSNLAFREGEDQNQYAPQYLLTPTGARCNRVFLVGTLTERDDIGGDTEYWRGRVVDPTGSMLIYAGQYQPEAAQALASIEPPAFVAVVGKPSLYQTEDGSILISVRAESIQRVDDDTRKRWMLETARQTLERLDALEGAESKAAGFSTADKVPTGDDVERAKGHYHTDVEQYRQMVARALITLRADLDHGGGAAKRGAEAPSGEATRKAETARKAGGKTREEFKEVQPEPEEEVETLNLGKKR
jgi:RPA family protein